MTNPDPFAFVGAGSNPNVSARRPNARKRIIAMHIDHVTRELRMRENVHKLQHEMDDHLDIDSDWGPIAHDKNMARIRELRTVLEAIQPMTWKLMGTDEIES